MKVKKRYIALGLLVVYVLSGFLYSQFKEYKKNQERVKTLEAHAQGQCYAQGKYYDIGQSFSAGDGCNICYCSSSELHGAVASCTEVGCFNNASNRNFLEITFAPQHLVINLISSFYNYLIRAGSRIFI